MSESSDENQSEGQSSENEMDLEDLLGSGEGAIGYEADLEPEPTEEEAIQYRRQLEEEQNEELLLLSRFSNEVPVANWCKCSNCSIQNITKPEECWCCTEIPRSGEALKEAGAPEGCILTHPGFEACCLNPWVLRNAAMGLKTKAQRTYTTTKNQMNAADREFFRSVSYREYVRLVYKYVGASRRMPLPNCVYNKIRQVFPNEGDHYKGYVEVDAVDSS